MIQVLVLAGLIGGCMAILSSCSGPDGEDADDSLSSNTIENKLNEEPNSAETVVEYAEVTCTCAGSDSDRLNLLSDNKRVTLV